MGIYLVGSTLQLDGHLTRQDCPFLQMVLREAIQSGHGGLRVELAGLLSADDEVLTCLSAGCFLLRLLGRGAAFKELPDWLPGLFHQTVPCWAGSLDAGQGDDQTSRPPRRVGGQPA